MMHLFIINCPFMKLAMNQKIFALNFFTYSYKNRKIISITSFMNFKAKLKFLFYF